MSDENKLEPGQKRCPKCQGIIQGRRTITCPHCGVDTMEGREPKPKKTVAAPAPVTIPDPLTYQEITNFQTQNWNEWWLVFKSPNKGFFGRPKMIAKYMEFATNITIPDCTYETFSTIA